MSHVYRVFACLALAAIIAPLAGCSRDSTEAPAVVVEEVEEVEVPEISPSDVSAAMAELPEADRAAALAQKVCPVSNEALGSMGAPIKVNVKGRDVFLCCESCREGLLAEPDKYLAKIDAQ